MSKYLSFANVAVVILGAAAALATTFLLGNLTTEQPLHHWPRFVNGKRAFPNIALVNQRGETVRFYDDLVKDRRVFVYFIYSRCEGT